MATVKRHWTVSEYEKYQSVNSDWPEASLPMDTLYEFWKWNLVSDPIYGPDGSRETNLLNNQYAYNKSNVPLPNPGDTSHWIYNTNPRYWYVSGEYGNSSYTNTSLYPKGYNIWIVPETARYRFELKGATGINDNNYAASSECYKGATVEIDYNLTVGDILCWTIGQRPYIGAYREQCEWYWYCQCGYCNTYRYCAGGGGSTTLVKLENGLQDIPVFGDRTWNYSTDGHPSNITLIAVAGGGGGNSDYYSTLSKGVGQASQMGGDGYYTSGGRGGLPVGMGGDAQRYNNTSYNPAPGGAGFYGNATNDSGNSGNNYTGAYTMYDGAPSNYYNSSSKNPERALSWCCGNLGDSGHYPSNWMSGSGSKYDSYGGFGGGGRAPSTAYARRGNGGGGGYSGGAGGYSSENQGSGGGSYYASDSNASNQSWSAATSYGYSSGGSMSIENSAHPSSSI